MNSKECEVQLKELIEAWDLDEALLNQTDINAIKHLMLENQMQQDKITELRIQVSSREEVTNELQQRIDKAIEILKLCNSQCAKETIEILKGSDSNV